MNGTYNSRYKKRNATTGIVSTIFTYHLSGTPEELERYAAIKEAEGFPVTVDDSNGKMLYFDTTYHGATCKIIMTDNDKVVVDNPTLDFLQSQMNLVTDPTVKAAFAQQIAMHIVSTITTVAVTAATVTPVAVVQPEPTPEPTKEEEPTPEPEPEVVTKKDKIVKPAEAKLG